MRASTLALAVLLATPALTDAAPTAPSALQAVPPGVVDGATARRLVEAGARLVDVRTPQEYAAGHLPGAVLVPFDQMATRAAGLGPPETPIILYCRTGRRTAIAARTLAGLGFTRVWDLQGMANWTGTGGR